MKPIEGLFPEKKDCLFLATPKPFHPPQYRYGGRGEGGSVVNSPARINPNQLLNIGIQTKYRPIPAENTKPLHDTRPGMDMIFGEGANGDWRDAQRRGCLCFSPGTLRRPATGVAPGYNTQRSITIMLPVVATLLPEMLPL
jgi:hypothetical protein